MANAQAELLIFSSAATILEHLRPAEQTRSRAKAGTDARDALKLRQAQQCCAFHAVCCVLYEPHSITECRQTLQLMRFNKWELHPQVCCATMWLLVELGNFALCHHKLAFVVFDVELFQNVLQLVDVP